MHDVIIGNGRYGCTWVACFDLSNDELNIAYNDVSYTIRLKHDDIWHQVMVGKDTTQGEHLSILHRDGKAKEFREYAFKLYLRNADPKILLAELKSMVKSAENRGRSKMQEDIRKMLGICQ